MIGAFTWLHLRINDFDTGVIYVLLGVFAFYSTLLCGLVIAYPLKAPKLYRIFLAPDLIFVTLLIKYTGSVNSEFFVAYYLLVAVHTYYYQSLKVGLLNALLSSLLYFSLNWRESTLVHWSDLLVRLTFLFVVALSTGFLSLELKEAYDKLKEAYEKLKESNLREKKTNEVLDCKLSQITSLYEVSQDLLKAESQEQVQALAAQGAKRLLGTPVVYLMRPRGGSLRCVECIGLPEALLKGKEIKTHQGLAGKVFKSRKPMISDDIQTYPGSALKEVDAAGNLRAIISVPLEDENRILGVLNASHFDPGAFNNEDLRVFGVFASMVGAALSRTERYESTKRLAIIDIKTDLYNYRYFKALLEEYITKKLCSRLAVLMLILITLSI